VTNARAGFRNGRDLRRRVGLIVAIGGTAVFVINVIRGVADYSLSLPELLLVPQVNTIGIIAALAWVSAFRSGAFWRWTQVGVFLAASLLSAWDAVPGSLTGYMLMLFGFFLAFEYDIVVREAGWFVLGLTVLFVAIMTAGMVGSGHDPASVASNVAGVVIMAALGWFLLAERIRRLRERERDLNAAVLEQTRELRRRYEESERLRVSLEVSVQGQRELLAEIHHRTKNNLQLVSTLIGFDEEEAALHDDTGRAGVARARIKALAVLHDRLYASVSAARVDLESFYRDYLEQLASLVSGDLRLRVRVDGAVGGGIDNTIRTCLALNEIVFGLEDASDRYSPPSPVTIGVNLDDPATLRVTVESSDGAEPVPRSAQDRFDLARQIVERIGGSLDRPSAGSWVLRAPLQDHALPQVR